MSLFNKYFLKTQIKSTKVLCFTAYMWQWHNQRAVKQARVMTWWHVYIVLRITTSLSYSVTDWACFGCVRPFQPCDWKFTRKRNELENSDSCFSKSQKTNAAEMEAGEAYLCFGHRCITVWFKSKLQASRSRQRWTQHGVAKIMSISVTAAP